MAEVKRLWTASDMEYRFVTVKDEATGISEEKPVVSSVTDYYLVTGAADEQAAITAAIGKAVNSCGLPYSGIGVDERLGATSWKISVSYAEKNSSGGGGSMEDDGGVTSFDISTQTKHVLQAIETKRYPADAPDYHGAINYDGEKVNGVDIISPVFSFSLSKRYKSFGASRQKEVAGVVGKINQATYHGFDAGEVLFVGCSGSQRGSEKWDVTYKFNVNFNQTNITIGDITGINKGGWEYLWAFYEKGPNEEGTSQIQKPIAVYVEKVYEDGNFSVLKV